MLCSAAASAAPANDYVLQGYVNYNSNDQMGWFYMNDKGSTTFVWADQLTLNLSPMMFGWMRNDRICGISSLLNGGQLYTYQYVEMNPENGEYLVNKAVNLKNDDGSINYLNYYRTAAYDPGTDRVYGYGYNAEGNAFVFKSSTPDFSETSIIREITDDEYCSSLTFNTSENRLVGFNRLYFVYIDLKTGNQTKAFYPAIEDFSYTYTGMMYDPSKRAYYWNYFTKDHKSHMALVDITNKKVTNVCDYTDMTQFSFMVPISGNEDPAAPMKPAFGEMDFPQGALSGNVSFTMPEKTNGGEALTGDLQWILSVDGNDVASGSGKPGEKVSAPVKDLTTGEHLFSVSVKSGEVYSLPESTFLYIGIDTPSAPANVKLDATTATWDAVTVGVHGGYVDPASLQYRVAVNGKEIGTTSSTSIPVSYPADTQYTAYTATVTAIGNGESSEAESNKYLTGKPLSLPLTLIPDLQQANLCTVEDTDGNGNVWEYNNGARGLELFISGYSADTKVDEWLFLPPMACSKADGVYSFAINAALNSAGDKPAQLQVCVGREADPEAMKTAIIPLTEITSTSLTEFNGLFSLTGDLEGAESIVIGIRAYAPEGGTRIKARRFKTELTSLSGKAPANPADLKIEAAPKGALKAILGFKMPERMLNGEAIPAGSDITVSILNDDKTAVTGKPGSQQNVTIDAYTGINEIEITPALGGVKGQTKKYEVYCGIDIPGRVTNLVADVQENNLEAYITWDAPTVGLNGGYVDPEGITYWLCTYDKVTDSYKQYAELGKIPEYPMFVKEGKLATYDVIIQAVSSAGASSEYASTRVQLGTPFTLGINEDFIVNGKPGINCNPISPVTTGEYENTSWSVANPAETNPSYATPSNVALIGSTTAAGTTGYIQFPKFSTIGHEGILLEFTTFQSNSTPKVNVYASTVGMTDYELIGQLPATGNGYTPQSLLLPDKYNQKGWVSIYLTVEYTAPYQNIVISKYRISSTSGIEDIFNGGNDGCPVVMTADGAITVTGASDKAITVFSADGKNVAAIAKASETETIHVQPGLYIVKAGDTSVKTIVR